MYASNLLLLPDEEKRNGHDVESGGRESHLRSPSYKLNA